MMGRDDSGTLAALKAHRRELIDPKINEYEGRIVKTMGDGLLLGIRECDRRGAMLHRRSARDGRS
jgi:class 3 adenylate cyclase